MSEHIEYRPVPVHVAKQIADGHGKEIVVILAYDAAHQMTHTTTFGKQPASKGIAAEWGEVCAQAIGAEASKSTWYEDYRATKEAEYKAVIDELVAALQPFTECERAWMEDGKKSEIRMDWMTAARDAIARASVLIKTPAKEPVHGT